MGWRVLRSHRGCLLQYVVRITLLALMSLLFLNPQNSSYLWVDSWFLNSPFLSCTYVNLFHSFVCLVCFYFPDGVWEKEIVMTLETWVTRPGILWLLVLIHQFYWIKKAIRWVGVHMGVPLGRSRRYSLGYYAWSLLSLLMLSCSDSCPSRAKQLCSVHILLLWGFCFGDGPLWTGPPWNRELNETILLNCGVGCVS